MKQRLDLSLFLKGSFFFPLLIVVIGISGCASSAPAASLTSRATPTPTVPADTSSGSAGWIEPQEACTDAVQQIQHKQVWDVKIYYDKNVPSVIAAIEVETLPKQTLPNGEVAVNPMYAQTNKGCASALLVAVHKVNTTLSKEQQVQVEHLLTYS